MLFAEYVFQLLPNGSIVFDKELKPELIRVKDDDEFVAKIVEDRVVLAKRV
jgi:hypothetical protein